MTAQDDRRPPAGAATSDTTIPASIAGPDDIDMDELAAQLKRRRRGAARVPTLDESGLRDPLLEIPPHEDEPRTFGLSADELWAEIRRCQRAGWQPWEIRARFTNPETIGAAA